MNHLPKNKLSYIMKPGGANMPEKKYFRCLLCGEVIAEEDLLPGGVCPICGADGENLVPCDENGNDL